MHAALLRSGRVAAADFNRRPLNQCVQGCVGRLGVRCCGAAPFTLGHAVLASCDYLSLLLGHAAERLPCVQPLLVNRALNVPMSVPRPLLVSAPTCLHAAAAHTPMAFTDGGQLDTSGVLALLAKGVRKVVSMQTGGTPYRTLVQCGGDLTLGVEPGLMALFGLWREGQDPASVVTQSAVFPIGAYLELRRQLDACKAAGLPLVASLRGLEVVANPFHGVQSGWRVDLLVWYIDAPKAWTDAVPQCKDVGPIESEFPIISAFGLYSNETVNLIADLAAWAVLSSAEKFMAFAEE